MYMNEDRNQTQNSPTTTRIWNYTLSHQLNIYICFCLNNFEIIPIIIWGWLSKSL